jgi:hypothetical protein
LVARAVRATARIPLFLLAFIAYGLPPSFSVVAAPATPADSSHVACAASPRTEENIAALLADATLATPAPTTGSATLPKGVPASEKETRAMKARVGAWLACQNAGEPLRAWSLFSDGYLARLLSRQGGLAPDAYATLATPSPSTSAPATLRAFRDARELPDGRLGAIVTIAYPSVPMPKTFFFTFVRQGNSLLIDGILGEISFSVP